MTFIRRLLRRESFEYVLYGAEDLSPPETGDLQIDMIGSDRACNPAQREFLRRRVSRRSFWWLMRSRPAWICLASVDHQLCHYTFVTSTHRYRRVFTVMAGHAPLLVGPCFTDEGMRGKAIYPRVLRYVVHALALRGFGPFFIHTTLDNQASIRGMEKAGFRRLGVWSGTRRFLNLRVTSQRKGD